jgi:hypothetical protein
MNDGNLLFESGVDETMALERVEAAELVGHDERCEGLAATACKDEFSVSMPVFCVDMGGEGQN